LLVLLFFGVGCTRLQEHSIAFPLENQHEGSPLLVVFHGAGQTPTQYLEVWQEEARRRGFMVLAPKMKNLNITNFDKLLNRVARRYQVDQNRIVLAGVSAGALVAREFLAAQPKRWKTVIFIAAPDKEYWLEKTNVEGFPPILFVHGEQDPQFKIVGVARQVELLRQKGIEVGFIRHPSGVHEHRPEWNGEIFDWIDSQLSE
jgi:predicted esterase